MRNSLLTTKILFNTKIYPFIKEKATVSALAIQNGHVVAIGTPDELKAVFPMHTSWQDLEGCTVLPGLIDAHIHLQNYGLFLKKVDCEVSSKQECLQRIKSRTQITPSGKWILGHGWNQNLWPEGFPSSADLDEISVSHPIYLTAKSLHAAWANRHALEIAGIDSVTPDPKDGKIQRDASGNPTGILLESAMSLVSSKVPPAEEAEICAALLSAQKTLHAFGITSVHDFDRRSCFTALQTLHRNDQLRLRVLKSIPLESLNEAIALGLMSGFGDDWLRIGSVKAFADGALGPRTAAMIQPYEEEPDNFGILMLDSEEILEFGREATRNGLSLAVHAIGDRAVHELLNAYAQLRIFEREQGLPPRRHRIEHVQIIHPQDVKRLAELGIIASMQPVHAISDMSMADRYWGKRSALSYAWQSQLNSGAALAFGSDAPVDSPNPFWGIHAAITRHKPGNNLPWYPEQQISLSAALQSYTHGAAFAGGLEEELGKLTPGALADLIVLPQDPFECSPDEIYNLTPLKTMLHGEWVFEH